jgi:uncharacterized oxidoreductase
VPTVAPDPLVRFATTLFAAAGVPADESALVATSLVASNLAGHDSHGVLRVMQYVQALNDGLLCTGVSLKILNQTPAVLTCDGQWGLGQVQAHRLLDLLVPMAQQIGLSAGTLMQCGHIGRLGEYGERVARQKLVLLATVNNHGFGRAVAPPGGTAGRIGTNPLCVAIPADGDAEVILDIGTSVCAEGKVRVAFNKGETVPEGWLLDAQGLPTTDPSTFYAKPPGTILPLGGPQAYKGFGLGLVLDLLAGGLSGGPCSRPEIGPRSANAVVFILFDPARFVGMAHFEREIHDLIVNVRSSPPTTAGATIQLPGDPERQAREKRLKTGIPIDEGTWSQLVALAGKLGVQPPES